MLGEWREVGTRLEKISFINKPVLMAGSRVMSSSFAGTEHLTKLYILKADFQSSLK
jgi:hypothetical protein